MKQRKANQGDYIQFLECYIPVGSRCVYGDMTLVGSGEKMEQISHIRRHLAWDDETFERKYTEYIAFKKEQQSLGIIPSDENDWLYSAFTMPWQSFHVLFLVTMLKEKNMNEFLSWANDKNSEKEFRVIRRTVESVGRYRKYDTQNEGECHETVFIFRKGYFHMESCEHTLESCVYLATCFPR